MYVELMFYYKFGKKDLVYRLCHDIEFVIYLGTVPTSDENPGAPSVYITSDCNPNEYFTHLNTIFCLDNYAQVNLIGILHNVTLFSSSVFLY